MALNIKISWQRQTHKHANGYWAFVGKLRVGSVIWTSGSRDNNSPRWAVMCDLPGLKAIEEKYETKELAMQRFESRVRGWFNLAEVE